MSVFFYQNDTFNLKIILIFSLLVFITSLLIINFYVEKNIYKRVEKIYKNIMVLESKPTPVQNMSISNDMDFLENEINRYAKLKKLEVQSFKEREEFRKEFVGNVAHELKTPLFTVQGYISTLLDGAMDNPEILKKYLQRADKGVERLIYIVQDLDLITKIEFGENKLSKSNFDIIVLIKNIFEDLEMKAKKKNISLLIDDSVKNSIMVYADMERIQQVVTNLIVNSIKYGDTNGTTEVSVEPFDAKKFVVRITDNGEGIDEEHIPRLFERFYRVDKSGSRTEGGSGLGLSIVKHIIDAHEESVFVESKYGIGSEFSFTLPEAI
jgi:two-component system phosphate regulon sensor histidine kinase PhoR